MKEIGKIIVFRVSTQNKKSTIDRFCRQFYGYLDRSHNDRYRYQRKGFIDNYPYIKPLRGVIVVRKKDADKIISYLESYNVEIYARDIILLKDDLKKLKI